MKNKNHQKPKICFIVSIIGLLSVSVFSDTIPGVPKVSQQKAEWCWAAVCESLVKFWDKKCTKTQTQIAAVLTSQNIAAHPDSIPRCLTENGKAVNLQVIYYKTTIPWKEVKAEADSGRPFYFMLTWNNGQTQTNYHSNVFCGYLNDSNKLKFMDPGGGSYVFRTWAGLSSISGSGKWWHTYKTRAKVPNVQLKNYSFAQVDNGFRIIQNRTLGSTKAVTFLFNSNSDAAGVLRIYNALGACVYESGIDGNMTQASWNEAASIPSGMYYVSLAPGNSRGIKNGARVSFYLK